MSFSNNAYAKIWKVEKHDNYTKVNMSTSKKNRDTGEYETDFSGFVNMIGKAHKLAESLEANDRIKILSCEVTTKYDKAKDTKYTNFTIFDWEPAGTSAGEPKQLNVEEPVVEEQDDEALPF